MSISQRPMGVIIASTLMVVFGLAEVVTAFTHRFFGISTSGAAIFTASAVAIGSCYFAAGFLILSMRRKAAVLAIVLLISDVAGRIALTLTGYYPTDSFKQTFSIIAGTVIAGVFAIYIGIKRKSFS